MILVIKILEEPYGTKDQCIIISYSNTMNQSKTPVKERRFRFSGTSTPLELRTREVSSNPLIEDIASNSE